jgi:hypothetical protein
MLRRLAGLFFALVLIALAAAPALAVRPAPAPDWNPGILPQGSNLEVATQGATGTTESSAVLNGYLASLGPYSTAEVWFEWNGQPTPRQVMHAPGTFSYRVGGLTSGTTYQYNAAAGTNLLGGQVAYGSPVQFTTIHTIPKAPIAITTSTAADITSNTATLHGYLEGMGPYPSVIVWFEYGNTTGFGRTTSQQTLYNAGPFSIQVDGLNPNSGYYFRAAARPSAVGVASVYGSTNIFTTSGAASLDVNTGAPSNITATSATIVGYLQSLGAYRSAYVWFEWGISQGYGQTTPMQTLFSPGQYNFTLQNLNPGTTYHFRALAVPTSAGSNTVHGFDGVFTTTYAPGVKVSTGAASNVGAGSATFNGMLMSMGTSNLVNTRFEYGTDTTFGNSTAQQSLDSPRNFSYSISGLKPGATYYYRSAAFANGNEVFGQYSTFQTTASSPVTIYTNPAGSVSSNAATLNAHIGSMGNLRSVKVFFNWGKDTGMSGTTTPQTLNSPGTVSFQLTNLAPGTNYSFQAIAETPDGGKVYGGQEIFSTISNSRIAVSTLPATGVTGNTAILNGTLNDLGNTPTVQVWFEYGTTADYGNSTEMQAMGNTGPFSTSITGLASGRTYYYRSVALNPTGGGRSVTGPATMFSTPGSGPGPAPGPMPETPLFIWMIMGGFIIVIIILIILLASRGK